MSPTRSVGQAIYRSKADSSRTSIVQRLASRTLAGQSLGIRIHQHIGFQLHLVWHIADSNNYKSLRCIERVFLKYKDIHDFCMELKNGAFEGLCNCVCTRFLEWTEDKVEQCRMEEDIHSHFKKTYEPRSWDRTLNPKKEHLFKYLSRIGILRSHKKQNVLKLALHTLSRHMV